jgi:hypothetical protein
VLYMLNLVFALFAFMRMQSILTTMDPFVPINCISYPDAVTFIALLLLMAIIHLHTLAHMPVDHS